MTLHFTKIQGIGNDYIYVDCTKKELENPGAVAVKLSPRHFSVGSDGLIMICHSDIADAKMRMFNADGSEGKMCGNGIRCVGKFVYDKGIVTKTELDIETLSGIKHLHLTAKGDDSVSLVTVDMGSYSLDPEVLPLSVNQELLSYPISIAAKEYRITAVSMGNPHAVCYLDDIHDLPIEQIGPIFETHKLFPERINTEFVHVIDANTLEMRVWERGSGETYACGTGACATAVSSILNGYCRYNEDITVKLIGGNLIINVSEDHTVHMTGTATTVYEGECEI